MRRHHHHDDYWTELCFVIYSQYLSTLDSIENKRKQKAELNNNDHGGKRERDHRSSLIIITDPANNNKKAKQQEQGNQRFQQNSNNNNPSKSRQSKVDDNLIQSDFWNFDVCSDFQIPKKKNLGRFFLWHVVNSC